MDTKRSKHRRPTEAVDAYSDTGMRPEQEETYGWEIDSLAPILSTALLVPKREQLLPLNLTLSGRIQRPGSRVYAP